MTHQAFVSLEEVLKTCPTRLQRNNFWSSKTSWSCLGRQKIVTLMTSSRYVFKTSSRYVFKTSWRHVLKISSRRLGNKKWEYLYLKNLNRYVSNKSIFHNSISDESKANPKSLIRSQCFQYSSYFKIQAAFLFWELKSLITVWCYEISWIQIWHYKTGDTIKMKF